MARKAYHIPLYTDAILPLSFSLMTMQRNTILFLSLAPFLLFACSTSKTISSFEECVQAGNPVMESYPRQCRHGETTFTEVLEVPLIGGDTDEHGCLGAAGYTWCEPKQICLRMWEEPCYEKSEDAIAYDLAMKYEKPMDQVHVTLSQETEMHAKGGVRFGEGGPGEGGLVLAAKINGVWRTVFDGNGSVDCADLEQYAFPEEMMEGVCQ